MGSFVGHVDEATVFLILAVWWMYNAFSSFIKAGFGRGQYYIQTSYWSTVCGKKVPLEQILKIAFPFVGFMAEVIDGKFRFLDEQGNFIGLNHMQHMSIYGIFMMHGIIDLLMRLDMPFVAPHMDFVSAGVAFLWYAVSFFYHANMEGKEQLEVMVHMMPINCMYAISLMCFLAIYMPRSFVVDCLRSYGLLTLGTWFWHTSFIMYLPGFPGKYDNPRWDRSDHRNVHFVIALFGYHLIINFIFMMVFYAVCYLLLARGLPHRGAKYNPVINADEEVALIEADDTDKSSQVTSFRKSGDH